MTSEPRRLQPRKQPRQVRAELTRQRVLSAAAHIFAEYGYAAGTTNRIAERARISIGSLYQYFPNKDAILAELMTRHLHSVRVTGTYRDRQDLPDSLEEIIRVFVRAKIENHLDDPELLRVMFEQAPRTTELLRRVTQQQQEMIHDLRDLLNRHSDVRVEDRETAARLVVSVLGPVVHHLVAAPESIDIARLEDQLVAMITGYLRTNQ